MFDILMTDYLVDGVIPSIRLGFPGRKEKKLRGKDFAAALYPGFHESDMGLAGWSADEMCSGLSGVLDIAAASEMNLATIMITRITGIELSTYNLISILADVPFYYYGL